MKKNNLYFDIIIVFLIISMGAVGFLGSSTYTAQQEKTVRGAITEASLEVQSYATRAEGHMGLYLSLGNETDKNKFYDRIKLMNENIRILEEVVTGENDLVKVKRIKDASAGLKDAGDALIRIYDENPSSFSAKDNEDLLLAVKNFVFIVRDNSVALAQSRIVSSAIGASSSVKQAEGFLLLLYLNLGDSKYRQSYYENLGDLKDELFILEGDVVTQSGKALVSTIKTSAGILEEEGENLISAYESNPAGFNAKNYAGMITGFHDATSLIRETGVNLAKEELASDATAGYKNDLYRILFFVFVAIALVITAVRLFTNIKRNSGHRKRGK